MARLESASGIVPEHQQRNDEFSFYHDRAREICRRVRHKSHLADDEIIILAIVAAQLALAKHVEPSDCDAERTLDAILGILDHREVVAAINSKMDRLLNGERTVTRFNAPPAASLPSLSLKDPDEPSGE